MLDLKEIKMCELINFFEEKGFQTEIQDEYKIMIGVNLYSTHNNKKRFFCLFNRNKRKFLGTLWVNCNNYTNINKALFCLRGEDNKHVIEKHLKCLLEKNMFLNYEIKVVETGNVYR